MGKALNLIGQKFNKLLVIEKCKSQNGRTQWLCQCDCGNQKNILGRSLTSGNTTSCGCVSQQNRQKLAKKNLKNELNNKYGKLVVIKELNHDKRGRKKWLCKCDCGKEVQVTGAELRNGHTKSCGCLHEEIINKIHEKKELDLTLKRFGKLLVTEKAGSNKFQNNVWLCKCDCGNSVKVPTHSLMSGSTQSCGCIKSLGEYTIANILMENNIVFEKQKTFETCRTKKNFLCFFDFYIPSKNYLIEFDGIQHFKSIKNSWNTEERFKKTQENDKIKNKWCKENNIPLIRIPYTRISKLNIEDLLLETSNFILKGGD